MMFVGANSGPAVYPTTSGSTRFRYEAIAAEITDGGDSTIELIGDIAGANDLSASGSARPVWATAVTPNGSDAIRFDGSDDFAIYSSGSPSMDFGDNAGHYFFVVNVDRAMTNSVGCIWGWGSSTNTNSAYRLVFLKSTNQYQFNAADNANVDRITLVADASASGYDIIELVDNGESSGASIIVHTSGDSASVGSYTDATLSLNRWALGCMPRASNTLFCEMDIVAAIGIDTVQSAGVVTDMIAYLTDRYLA